MTKKELFLRLTENTLPKDEVKQEMFKVHNSLVGKTKYIVREENPNTGCGSCIQRVKINLWKWYHYDEKAPTYKGLIFTGRLGIYNMPLYRVHNGEQEE